MKIVVLAQGRSSRLPGKHHLHVGGEPILGRVLRLAAEISDDVVLVARCTPEYAAYGASIYTDEHPAGNTLDRLWNTRQLWGGEVPHYRSSLVLLGDVVYSPAALRLAAEEPLPGQVAFVGRTKMNRCTGKVGAEIYALRMGVSASLIVRHHLQYAYHRLTRGGKLWGLRVDLNGTSVWRETDDYTDDVDTFEDFQAMERYATTGGLA
jgi:GTP:adenosylcobinamide-phosphate guanylyltransferase